MLDHAAQRRLRHPFLDTTRQRAWIIALSMIVAAVVTPFLVPREAPTLNDPKADLERIFPDRIGKWDEDKSIVPLLVPPETLQKLGQLYDYTLARTYVRPDGGRVMVSVAYGGRQSRSLQVHRPEVCYTAQGFAVSRSHEGLAESPQGQFRVRRLLAQHGQRIEPITYWIRMGDRTVLSGVEQALTRFQFALQRRIPDGLLVRISSVDADIPHAYSVQEDFIRDLISGLGPNARSQLLGAAKS